MAGVRSRDGIDELIVGEIVDACSSVCARDFERDAFSGVAPTVRQADHAARNLVRDHEGDRDFSDARAHPHAIQVYSLGSFRVFVHGDALGDEGWHRKKARQLFKLLLSRLNRRSPKDEVIELLWPESDPETGSTN